MSSPVFRPSASVGFTAPLRQRLDGCGIAPGATAGGGLTSFPSRKRLDRRSSPRDVNGSKPERFGSVWFGFAG